MKTLRRWWYRFLRVPDIFVTARWMSEDELMWFVYADGEWFGPYDLQQSNDVYQRLSAIHGG